MHILDTRARVTSLVLLLRRERFLRLSLPLPYAAPPRCVREQHVHVSIDIDRYGLHADLGLDSGLRVIKKKKKRMIEDIPGDPLPGRAKRRSLTSFLPPPFPFGYLILSVTLSFA